MHPVVSLELDPEGQGWRGIAWRLRARRKLPFQKYCLGGLWELRRLSKYSGMLCKAPVYSGKQGGAPAWEVHHLVMTLDVTSPRIFTGYISQMVLGRSGMVRATYGRQPPITGSDSDFMMHLTLTQGQRKKGRNKDHMILYYCTLGPAGSCPIVLLLFCVFNS